MANKRCVLIFLLLVVTAMAVTACLPATPAAPTEGVPPHCDTRSTGGYLTTERDVHASANRYAGTDR
jgi:hypothetical protein